MDKHTTSLIRQLQQELKQERLCCDQLAEALVQGGVDRQFQALLHHEVLRNGLAYPGVKVGQSAEGRRFKLKRNKTKPAKQRNHPSQRLQNEDEDNL